MKNDNNRYSLQVLDYLGQIGRIRAGKKALGRIVRYSPFAAHLAHTAVCQQPDAGRPHITGRSNHTRLFQAWMKCQRTRLVGRVR